METQNINMSDSTNIEENNISGSQLDQVTQKVDLELELEKMSNVETQPAKQPEDDKLGQKTLDLLTPEIEASGLKAFNKSQAKLKVIGNTRDIVREIQGIELLLGTKTKGLYGKTRLEVEIILDQRKAQLLELNKPKEKEETENTHAKEELTDDIFSNVKKPEDRPQDNPVQEPTDNILEETPKKPPVVHKKKSGKKTITEDPLDKANADMLFRMNLLFLFSVETISEKYADKLNTSFTGATKKMSLDYDRDDYLKGIYKRVYQENKEMIQTYASPLSELALYNASVLGTFAATNLDKTIKKSN